MKCIIFFCVKVKNKKLARPTVGYEQRKTMSPQKPWTAKMVISHEIKIFRAGMVNKKKWWRHRKRHPPWREVYDGFTVKRVQRDAMGPTNKSVYWSHKSHERCSRLDLGPVYQWRLLLEEYGPKIVYIKGIHNTMADAVLQLEYDPSVNQTAESFHTTKVRDNNSQRQYWMTVS